MSAPIQAAAQSNLTPVGRLRQSVEVCACEPEMDRMKKVAVVRLHAEYIHTCFGAYDSTRCFILNAKRLKCIGGHDADIKHMDIAGACH